MNVELYSTSNSGGKTVVTLERREDGSIQLFYHDLGSASDEAFGDSDYEAWATVPVAALSSLAFALLFERYKDRSDALSDFRTFCAEKGIHIENGSWT